MLDLANSNLVGEVPGMVAILISLVTLLGAGGALIRYVVKNITSVTEGFNSTVLELQSRHEVNETQRAELTRQLTLESHKFHEKLTEGTHKVIVENTVQMALNTNTLGKVLEKLNHA